MWHNPAAGLWSSVFGGGLCVCQTLVEFIQPLHVQTQHQPFWAHWYPRCFSGSKIWPRPKAASCWKLLCCGYRTSTEPQVWEVSMSQSWPYLAQVIGVAFGNTGILETPPLTLLTFLGWSTALWAPGFPVALVTVKAAVILEFRSGLFLIHRTLLPAWAVLSGWYKNMRHLDKCNETRMVCTVRSIKCLPYNS